MNAPNKVTVFTISLTVGKMILSAPRTVLDVLLNECWLSSGTCKWLGSIGTIFHWWHSNKINECHNLDTILLPPVKSYQVYAPKEQILATGNSKLLSCMVVICKTIGNHPTINYLKFCLILDPPRVWFTALHCQLRLNVYGSPPILVPNTWWEDNIKNHTIIKNYIPWVQ